MKKIVIAIDGHSSCGKSTLAKDLAAGLSYGYIDSGAMYRAVTLYFLQHHIDFNDQFILEKSLDNITIRFDCNHLKQNRTLLNGEDVEEPIREMAVSEKVSQVAALSVVRKKLVEEQRRMGKHKGIVMDGRDIGTVVFPDAELKIFLTASEDIRVERRFLELSEKGIQISREEVRKNLLERDHIDSTRKDSPLRQAEDAIVIDNSDLTREMQFRQALDLAMAKINTP